MLDRWVEDGLLDVLTEGGVGCIAFSPLEQGMLSNKYLNGIPADSRAGQGMTYLEKETVEKNLPKIKELNKIAVERGQSLSQMAIAWLLHNKAVTSVLVGVSKIEQLVDNAKTLENTSFSDEEVKKVKAILTA